jgi:uncharacterized protein (TIGR03435 family)
MRRILLTTLLAAAAMAQATRPAFTEFEVAAVKPAEANAVGRWIRMQTVHQFVAHNSTLLYLIAPAYNVSPHAISGGPAWVDVDRFEITAKAPGEVRPTWDEQMAMLRNLLTDRFQLTFHREPREMAAYVLTVAKGGSKLKQTKPSADAPPEGQPPLVFSIAPDVVRMNARSVTLAEVVSVMQRAALPHPVLDRTGLTGLYDFDLEFAPDETVFGGILKATDTSRPGLFTALQQQLGLRLESTKATVDTIAIDRAERPSGN